MTTEPDVREAAATCRLGDAFLEGVKRTGLIGSGWRGLAKDVAEVEEVLMCSASLRQG